MQILKEVFGVGKDLYWYQMGCRAIVVFIVALLLIRLSGRRSFGQKTPLDTIVAITMGATLSRAIVGASEFFSIVCACVTIALVHRMFGWVVVHNKYIGRLLEGEKIVLYENGGFHGDNMAKALVCEEDVKRGIRKV